MYLKHEKMKGGEKKAETLATWKPREHRDAADLRGLSLCFACPSLGSSQQAGNSKAQAKNKKPTDKQQPPPNPPPKTLLSLTKEPGKR